jgi:hypothetical protein
MLSREISMANDSHACESGNRFRTLVAHRRAPFAYSSRLKPVFRVPLGDIATESQAQPLATIASRNLSTEIK